MSFDDSYEIDQWDSLYGTDPTVNDTDIDGDDLTWSIISGPTNGAVVKLAGGSFRYVANAGFVGDDEFVYQSHDGLVANVSNAKVKVKVNPKILNDWQYDLGTTPPPKNVDLDPGAGGWGSESSTSAYYLFRTRLLYLLDHPTEQAALNSFAAAFNAIWPGDPVPTFSFGPEAVAHMKHFLSNTNENNISPSSNGTPLTVDMVKLLSDSPAARADYETEFSQAVDFVRGLCFIGPLQITSKTAFLAETTGSANWEEAVGQYTSWGSGTAFANLRPDGRIQYTLSFTYNFYDPYDWNPNSTSKLQQMMARLHRMGLAKEFVTTGSITKNVSWIEGDPALAAPAP